MNTVPKMISTKDLDYICDMFNWNFTACKKAYHFAQECTDKDVANILNEAAAMHKEHCQFLISLLQ